MHERRPTSRSLQARRLREVRVLVPEGCAETLRRFARELRKRQRAEPAFAAPQWRTLSPSAHLMSNFDCDASCSIRDTGAPGIDRFLWNVTVLGHPYPVAAGRAGELTEARALAEQALGDHAAEWRGVDAADYWLTQARLSIVDVGLRPGTGDGGRRNMRSRFPAGCGRNFLEIYTHNVAVKRSGRRIGSILSRISPR
jgi:hypothetical protein